MIEKVQYLSCSVRLMQLLATLTVVLSLPFETSALTRQNLHSDSLFVSEWEPCRNDPVNNSDPLGLTAWEWMITGQWNPSPDALQGANEGLGQANKASQIVAGAAHVISEAVGHLIDVGRGAAYSGALDYGLVPGQRIPISDFYDVTPQEFVGGAWGALAKRQGTQVVQGTYGAKQLGKDILQTELAVNPITGSGLAGFTVGTGIYEGNAVTVGEGAAQFAMVAAPYRGISSRISTRTVGYQQISPASSRMTISSLDDFTLNAADVPPAKGFFDIVGHGSSRTMEYGPRSSAIAHGPLARLIQQNPAYRGQPIRLISCDVGRLSRGFAQGLADRLGVVVRAPNDLIHVGRGGKYIIGPDEFTPTGQWLDFTPGGGK